MPTGDITKTVGYHGVSNFYHIFRQRFGETPQTVQALLQSNKYLVIFIGCFHTLASNSNQYIFAILASFPAKTLIEG